MYNYILKDKGFEIRGDSGDVRQLQALEVCLFHVKTIKQLEVHEELIRFAVSKSRMVVISMPVALASAVEMPSQIKKWPGLFALSVRYRIAGAEDVRIKATPIPGQEGDLQLVNHYQSLQETYREADGAGVKIIPEIEITDDLQLLGPTLMALGRRSPPWVVLAVDRPPTPSRVASLRDCFEYLQIRGFPLIDIHFSFECKWAREWKAQSECFYSGPEEFHIDLSNRCTHSCVFCALYSPAVIEDLKATNRLDDNMRKFMNAQLNEEKALDLIQSLPITTRLIQFGGAGDPMLHPKAIELITHARERAIPVEILSNMDYFKDGDHEKLTQLGGDLDYSIKFIVNISGATPETYVLTRPRQTAATFQKIVGTLKKFSDLREENGGRGVHFAMMCVVNRLNVHEAPLFVELAKEVRAAQMWFKPLELHHRLHHVLLPKPEEKASYVRSLRLALTRADELGVKILDREFLEETLRKQAESHP
jgi:MoaA/NifB/PqqE/SkfB family radical SAM enzyme